jgi:hypothetical protein
MKTSKHFSRHIFLILALLFSLAACAAETPPAALCEPDSRGFIPLPTRPLGLDPDLRQPAPDGPMSGDDCLPATAAPPDGAPLNVSAASPRNESLAMGDQQLAAAAVGDDMLALAWLEEGDLIVSLARGGSFLQARRVDRATSASLVFSTVNRLHLAYERDGLILYQATDQGAHPAEPAFWLQAAVGQNPQIALDGRNRAHILYESGGDIWHAEHLYDLYWHTVRLGPGHTPRVVTFYDQPGRPNAAERGFALSYLDGNTLHLRTYGLTPLLLPGWTMVAQLTLPELPMGGVALHSLRAGEHHLLAAAWTSHAPAPPPPPVPVPPTYEAVNPLAPYAVVNPDRVHSPFNAVRIFAENAVFDGGLYQVVNVLPGTAVTFSAYGLAFSSDGADPTTPVNPADMRLQIGLDPTGGTNPDGGTVLWSGSANPLTQYQPFTVSGTAVTDRITLFLRARPDGVRVHNQAYWDSATLSGGSLANGEMELFSGGIPAGWTPFYEDSGALPAAPRDRYTVYAAWSADGGATWSHPFPASENRLPGQGLTGAIQPNVYPFLSVQGQSQRLHLFYIYESGDPPPQTAFIRYGRPVTVSCDLTTGTCDEPQGNGWLAETPPASDLILAAYPLLTRRGLLAWGGLQTDYERRDVYAVAAAVRR